MTSEFSKKALREHLPEFLDSLIDVCGDDYPEYRKHLEARLIHGIDAYGDVSFHRTPIELLGEMRCETYDVPDWGVILQIVCLAVAKANGTMEEYKKLKAALKGISRDSYRLWHRMKRAERIIHAIQTPPAS